jgi:hypothetical protein
VVRLATPVLVLVAVTTVLGTTAPEVSVTVPAMLPVVACPRHGTVDEIQAALASTTRIRRTAHLSPVNGTVDLISQQLRVLCSKHAIQRDRKGLLNIMPPSQKSKSVRRCVKLDQFRGCVNKNYRCV